MELDQTNFSDETFGSLISIGGKKTVDANDGTEQ